jgi:hypothetical protein
MSKARTSLTRSVTAFLIFTLFLLASASSFGGYFGKWGFRDGDVRFSFAKMVEGRADKPFVYRRLLPAIANTVEQAVPQSAKQAMMPALIKWGVAAPTLAVGVRSGEADNPRYALRYNVIYYIDFALLFASMFLMSSLVRRAGFSSFIAVLAPVLFALVFPLLLENGGYFYDVSEVFLMFAALRLARPKARWLLPLLAVVGAYNKESYLFFLLTLAPLVIETRRDWKGALILGGSVFVAGAVYLWVKGQYVHNPGGATEFHLFDNLVYYINPLSLLKGERTYGVNLPAAYSTIFLPMLVIVCVLGWRRIITPMRHYIIAAAVVSAPLFLLFAYPGEIRNLSFLYPALLLFIAGVLERFAKAEAGHTARA